ncbi:MAG: hypothetical protein EOO69_09350 [Moraxellaceae bacterium]|nr:MAG: hypothetical protein EOO69_09350 [Moraxellaceae bacterium]
MNNVIRQQALGWIGGALIIVMMGSLLGFWGYHQLALGIELNNQPVEGRFPSQVVTQVEQTGRLQMQVDGRVTVAIPVHQIMKTSLKGRYPAQVNVNMQVPLNVDVPFKGRVPIHSMVDLETTTAAIFPHLPAAPLKVQVPVQVEVPIDTVLPVHTMVQVHYAGPLMMQFNQQISTPMDTVLHSTITMHHHVNSPPIGGFNIKVHPQQAAVAATLQARIRQPLNHIKLSRIASKQ